MYAIVSKLYGIFSDKNWVSRENHKYVFEQYCTLLEHLNSHQQKLILELTSRYVWLSSNEYVSSLIRLLNKIPENNIVDYKMIYLFPIMRPEDEKNVKSGHHFVYLFKSFGVMNCQERKHIKYEIITSFADLARLRLKSNEYLFLVDDFIGSGETINSTLVNVYDNPTIERNNIKIISLVAQYDVIDDINSKDNIEYFVDILYKKGISDYYESPVKEEMVKIMETIESLIPHNHFSFGYNQSEALVTMARTPDNTFPIFWSEYKINGKTYSTPFSRY